MVHRSLLASFAAALLAIDVPPVCFRPVSRVPQNGFVGGLKCFARRRRGGYFPRACRTARGLFRSDGSRFSGPSGGSSDGSSIAGYYRAFRVFPSRLGPAATVKI